MMEALNGIHFSLGGLTAALGVIGMLWWRLRQWNAARDEMTVWRRDKDHADRQARERMERIEARLSAFEGAERALFERQVHLEAQQKARG